MSIDLEAKLQLLVRAILSLINYKRETLSTLYYWRFCDSRAGARLRIEDYRRGLIARSAPLFEFQFCVFEYTCHCGAARIK